MGWGGRAMGRVERKGGIGWAGRVGRWGREGDG